MAKVIKRYAVDLVTNNVAPKTVEKEIFEEGQYVKYYIGGLEVNYTIFDDTGAEIKTQTDFYPLIQSLSPLTSLDIWKKIDELGGAEVFYAMVKDQGITNKTKQEVLGLEVEEIIPSLTIEQKNHIKQLLGCIGE